MTDFWKSCYNDYGVEECMWIIYGEHLAEGGVRMYDAWYYGMCYVYELPPPQTSLSIGQEVAIFLGHMRESR